MLLGLLYSGSNKNITLEVSMISRIALVLMLVVSFVSSPVWAEEPKKWVEGEHYKVLPFPVRTRDANKIEVVELFWYGCPHCYKFNPLVHAWAKTQPELVDFWLSPAVFGKDWKTHAQAFYALEALGVQEEMHQPFFDALVKERKRLKNEDQLAEFFASLGVKEKDFRKAFNSFSIKSKVDQADARGKSYRATGVPAMIVNGKYRVSSSTAGSNAAMLEVVDYLIAKELKAD
jgi:thiol:disulfide interchange protein DsbA